MLGAGLVVAAGRIAVGLLVAVLVRAVNDRHVFLNLAADLVGLPDRPGIEAANVVICDRERLRIRGRS
jgi:hypothetical protein